MKPSRLLLIALFGALSPRIATAQELREPRSAIAIRILTSQSQPAVGSGLGVMAEIMNVSDSAVYLHGKELTLMLPPELEGPFKPAWPWWALFPTEVHAVPQFADAFIKLQPGDTYQVFWSPGRTGFYDSSGFTLSVIRTIRSEMKFIFFTPGEYTLTVNGKYWFDPQGEYHTVTQSSVLHFAAPQSVILLGASFGGLIAFYLAPQGRRRLARVKRQTESRVMRIVGPVAKELAGIAGSVLLSAMVTILLSRISETQFLIKVSITDFWGAVAIGFIANYVGTKILDRFLPANGASSARNKSAEPTEEQMAQPSAEKTEVKTTEAK